VTADYHPVFATDLAHREARKEYIRGVSKDGVDLKNMDADLRWLAFGIVFFGIVAASLVSTSSLPAPALAGSDKLQHAVAYFALSLVSFYATDRDRWLAVAVGVAALGAGVEVAQAFLSYRTASVADAAANVVGVAVALVVSLVAER